MVGALPYMPRAARQGVLASWARVAHRSGDEPERTHDQAWDVLRTIVRVGG